MPNSTKLRDPISSDDTLYSYTPCTTFNLAKSRPQNALLLPSPRMVRSSSKENAPTSASVITRKKKSLPSVPFQNRPLIGRRVVFSPTPLPSLQASPKHKRPLHEHLDSSGSPNGNTGRPPKRVRRLGVYSNHPFLGLGSERDGSSSPEEDEDRSSPPTTPEEFGETTSRTGGGGRGGSYFKMPFALPGLTPPKPIRSQKRQQRQQAPVPDETRKHEGDDDAEDDDDDETDTATDSETESNFVSSLLLHRLPGSSSSTTSSSSPTRSPCMHFQALPRRSSATHEPPSSWLKGILKPVVGGTRIEKAANEKEGTRKNGRGRKHIIGWDDMRVVESVDASTADGNGGKGKESKPDVPEAVESEGGSRSRTTRSSGFKSASGKPGGEHEGEDDDDRKRRKPSASTGPPASGTSAGGGGRQINQGVGRPVARDDPWLLRTPLLVLKASLRPVSAHHVRPSTSSSAPNFAPLLAPRSSPLASEDAEMLVDADQEVDEFTNLFETPTFLSDVESAYVDLTRAIFQLPLPLPSDSTTLEPLRSFRKTFLRCVARDLENITSFSSWVKQTDTLSSPSSSSTSSASSSPIAAPTTSPTANAPGRTKKSLTEEQMGRLRDEVGVAQAGLRCATAIMRDARVHTIFSAQELTALLRSIVSLPSASGLTTLVQRDLFPFVPSLLHQQTLPPVVLAPLMESHVLPALERLFSLPYRADRHRVAFGETLSAIALLLSTHPKEMVRNRNWRYWFSASLLGLWDGPKKGINVKSKSLKVAGRLVRSLTTPIEWTLEGVEWVREREEIGRQVGEEMSALLNEVPEVYVQGKKANSTRLDLLAQQWTQLIKSKSDGNNNVDEANLLFHTALLSILPALLGPSFRKLEEKGIGPWIKPYNQLSQTQTSIHILATSTIAWTNLAYAFYRSTSVVDKAEVSWLLRPREDENKALNVLHNIFKARQDVWSRGEGSSTPTKKERKRSQAKAQSIAYAATLHGLAVSVHHGFSSVRDLVPKPDAPSLTEVQLKHFDEIFDRMVVPTLPHLTRSAFVETSRIGWNILAGILRPRAASDHFAVIEDIINPAVLEAQLACAKTSEFLDFALSALFAKSFDSSKMAPWGMDWTRKRLDKVLSLFEVCALSSPAALLDNCITSAWNSILDSVVGDESSLSTTLDWLVRQESSSHTLAPRFARVLWTVTLSRDDERVANGLTICIRKHSGSLDIPSTIFSAWQRTQGKPGYVAIALAQEWSEVLSDENKEVTTDRVASVMTLLRHFINEHSLASQADVFESLAASLSDRIWSAEHLELQETLRAILKPPAETESILQLCTLFLSTGHSCDPATQSSITALGASAVQSVLRSDTVRQEVIPLIADMLSAAPDSTYSLLYEAVLESLATIRPSSDSLVKFVPLLTPSLDRALDFHAGAVIDDDASQFETFAPRPHLQASLHPLLAFEKFWRKTYAPASLEIVYPPELLSRLHLVKGLAQDVMETQPQDSQLYSQLEESVRTFSSAEEQARAQAAMSVRPTLTVSTRDYDADLDQSRFHPPTGDLGTGDDEDGDTTVAASGPVEPSVSLHGSVQPRAASIIQETPREVLISNSKASYASLASTGDHGNLEATEEEVELPLEETLGDVKRRTRKRKRPTTEALPAPVASPTSSDDDVIVIVRSSQSSASSGKPARKKTKNSAKRRETKSSSKEVEPAPARSPNGPEPQERPVTSSMRPKRSKGKGRAPSDSTPSPVSTSESASPEEAVASRSRDTREARRRTQDEEAIRRVLSLPLETVAHVGKLIGGTASLHRLMAIGEAAKDYFEKLKRSPSRD